MGHLLSLLGSPRRPFAAVSEHGPQGDKVIADNAVHTELEKILHLHGVVHRPDMDRQTELVGIGKHPALGERDEPAPYRNLGAGRAPWHRAPG
jgi:hypothetical protein